MKILLFNEFINESEIQNLKFKIDETDEDYTKIEALIKNKIVGTLIMEVKFLEDSDFFEDVIDLPIFKKLYHGEETVVDMQYLRVESDFMNSGIGKMLMNKGIELMKRKGYTKFYLNASPMMFHLALGLNSLVNFYKKFGFIVILDQGGNVQMGMSKK
jgi:GNAT superfamily N-acetyltransferase